jgi:hypothetical protein
MFTLFGISDPYVWMAYVLSIGFTLVCILYGLLSGKNDVNKGDMSG